MMHFISLHPLVLSSANNRSSDVWEWQTFNSMYALAFHVGGERTFVTLSRQASTCTPNIGDRRSMQSLSTLAFVALWDPENGIIVLSAVDTTDDGDTSEPNATNLYHFPRASLSDIESFNFYQPPLSNTASSRSSECYRTLQSRHNTLFSGVTIPELQRRRGASQTSSTLGGLDVYLKGAALSTTHRHQPVYSFLNLNTDFRFPDDSEGAGTGAGYFQESALNIERVGTY